MSKATEDEDEAGLKTPSSQRVQLPPLHLAPAQDTAKHSATAPSGQTSQREHALDDAIARAGMSMAAMASPASPSLSIASPVIPLPGAMPAYRDNGYSSSSGVGMGRPTTASEGQHPNVVSTGISSFFRNLSLGGPPSSSSNLQASSSFSPSTSSMSSNRRASGSGSGAQQHTSNAAGGPGTPEGSRPSTPSSGSVAAFGASFSGGGQMKRAISGATRRNRKVSAMSTDTGNLGASPRPESGTPKGKEREAAQSGSATPQANITPSQSSSGLLTSSLSFLSGLASMDKFPPMFSFGAGGKEAYPRGGGSSDGLLHGKDRNAVTSSEVDLRLEDASAGGIIAVDRDEEPAAKTPLSPGVSSLKSPLLAAPSFASQSFSPSEASSTAGQLTYTSSADSTSTLSSDHFQDPLPGSRNQQTPNGSSRANASEPIVASPTSIIDPITFHAISRKSSEADAMRLVRERVSRGKELDFLERVNGRLARPIESDTGSGTPTKGKELPSTPKARPKDGMDMATPTNTASPQQRQHALGLGTPTRSSPLPPDSTEAKKPRRKSIFGRLGFSPSNKSASAPKPAKDQDIPPLPSSSSVPMFITSQKSSQATSTQHKSANQETESEAATVNPTSEDQDQAAVSRARAGTGESGTSVRSSASAAGTSQPGFPSSSKHGQHKNPYIKTKLKNKSRREFDHLFLAQEIFHKPSMDKPAHAEIDGLPSDSSSGRPASVISSTGSQMASEQSSCKPEKGKKKASAPSSSSAIWTLKFSLDGNYLATAGQDSVIRIWQVIAGSEEREAAIAAMVGSPSTSPSTAETPVTPGLLKTGSQLSTKSARQAHRASVSAPSTASTATANGGGKCPISAHTSNAGTSFYPAPVFSHKPLHEWAGHTSDVLDLSWSKNNFLLSSSMDKTVRLWHISRKECLCAFQHQDFVTSIAFHPKDDRYFLSGSLDAKLRLWSIPDKKVHCWTQLPELITCVSFTSEGKLAIAGTFVGFVLLFDVHDLSFVTKLHSKSTRGKNAKGRKITSIVPIPRDDPSEPERLLVTSNDSRMRLWDISAVCNAQASGGASLIPKVISEKNLDAKYKSHENTSSQIKATFSDDGRYVISGSEDRQCYIWQSGLCDFPSPFSQTSKKGADKSPGCESFAASSSDFRSCVPGSSGGGLEQGFSAGGIVTCAIFAPSETRVTLARGGDPLYGEYEDEQRDGGALRRSVSLQSSPSNTGTNNGDGGLQAPMDSASVSSATATTARGSIIITADDQSCAIRVYRNHPVFVPDSGSLTKKGETADGSARLSRFAHRRTSQVSSATGRSRATEEMARKRQSTEQQRSMRGNGDVEEEELA